MPELPPKHCIYVRLARYIPCTNAHVHDVHQLVSDPGRTRNTFWGSIQFYVRYRTHQTTNVSEPLNNWLEHYLLLFAPPAQKKTQNNSVKQHSPLHQSGPLKITNITKRKVTLNWPNRVRPNFLPEPGHPTRRVCLAKAPQLAVHTPFDAINAPSAQKPPEPGVFGGTTHSHDWS